MGRSVTMLDLVAAVSRFARGDDEVVATVSHLIHTGVVRLGGSFRDRKVSLRSPGSSGRREGRIER